ncbi:PadR family transcriptional regulator [Actinomyces sp. B33]|uniref:PadR family transcriptional regulator n=1 Tax=Actinomyces sp. B33 TaxID=2942131 RepID=UPI00233F86D8|nr:PadR family transcriptional regulator [Actinomyces sp. B33]MDC4233239.1 PadR family transcriptional regulator [Actinomyces sp. B33]
MTHNSFWILTALADGRRHGYDILREVSSLSDGAAALRPTTLYAALERLEREGLVVVDSEEIVDGRARRYYRLTDEGRDALGEESAALETMARTARARLRARPIAPAHRWAAPLRARNGSGLGRRPSHA